MKKILPLLLILLPFSLHAFSIKFEICLEKEKKSGIHYTPVSHLVHVMKGVMGICCFFYAGSKIIHLNDKVPNQLIEQMKKGFETFTGNQALGYAFDFIAGRFGIDKFIEGKYPTIRVTPAYKTIFQAAFSTWIGLELAYSSFKYFKSYYKKLKKNKNVEEVIPVK